MRQMTDRATDDAVLRGLLTQAYMEVIPTGTVVDRLDHLGRNSWVGISCSPKAGVEATLDTVEEINRRYPDGRFKLAPHVAARVIRDRSHLSEVVSRLEGSGVRAVFVPAGDSTVPAGRYGGALDLLRDLADIGHSFRHVGVAAHPEGHPLMNREELMAVLLAKQPYASYFVTQMCFDPAIIIDWLKSAREAGVSLHAWPGVPGVVEVARLVGLSLRIGVGRSVRMLRKQKGLAKNFLSGRRYRPEALVDGLAPVLAEPDLGVYGFHLFSFNQVEATERWRIDTLDRLGKTESLNP